MRLYKPNPTFGEPPNRSGRSDGKGCPKLHCPWGSRASEPQDSVRGLLRKKERRWTLHKVACLRRCERRERRGRKDPEFHTPHDARPQTPVDVARDGTAIMIHGSEGRARSCGGGLGCLCFFTLMGAAVVPRRGRFRLMGRGSSCQHHNCCPRIWALAPQSGLVDGPAQERDDQDHSERSSGHCGYDCAEVGRAGSVTWVTLACPPKRRLIFGLAVPTTLCAFA